MNNEEGDAETSEIVVREEQATMNALAYTKSIQLVKSKQEAPPGANCTIVSAKCSVFIVLPPDNITT